MFPSVPSLESAGCVHSFLCAFLHLLGGGDKSPLVTAGQTYAENDQKRDNIKKTCFGNPKKKGFKVQRFDRDGLAGYDPFVS